MRFFREEGLIGLVVGGGRDEEAILDVVRSGSPREEVVEVAEAGILKDTPVAAGPSVPVPVSDTAVSGPSRVV